MNWETASTIINVALVCFSIWQYQKGVGQEEKLKAQVKVWMQDANGISQALNRIVTDNLTKRYSTTNDVCNAVWAVQMNASSLYQSLYEERCVSEEEYKKQQKELSEALRSNQMEEIKNKKNSSQGGN